MQIHRDVNNCSDFCNQLTMLVLQVKGIFKEQAKQSKQTSKQSNQAMITVTNPSELAGESRTLDETSRNRKEIYPWKTEVETDWKKQGKVAGQVEENRHLPQNSSIYPLSGENSRNTLT